MTKPTRCPWAERTPLETVYHDTEWGRPLHDEHKLFEKVILEGMQAGLSWSLIIAKRDNFRHAFDNFDPEKMARYDEEKVAQLMDNAGIVRNRLKIESAIHNAQRYLEMRDMGETLNDFFWKYVDYVPIINRWETPEDVPGSTHLSTQISKVMKKRGFRFVGPTTVYALMQSSGMVNDHLTHCFVWEEVTALSHPLP